MYPYVFLAGRLFLGTMGTLIIYSALFLYEEEEGRLENRLEEWWQRIRRLHKTVITWEAAFLKIVAEITSRAFDRLFGERLLGLRAAAASISYSVASIFFVVSFGGFLFASPRRGGAFMIINALVASFFVFIGSLGQVIRRRIAQYLWLTLVLGITIPLLWWMLDGLTMEEATESPAWYTNPSLTAAMCLLTVASDFLFIALIRAVLKWVSHAHSFVKIAAVSIAITCLGAFLVVAPGIGSAKFKGSNQSGLLVLLSLSNCFDALVSISWLVVAAGMLLHRLVWPVIERPIYALYRHHFFTKQRKLALISGMGVLGLAFPAVGDALTKLLKVIHG